MCLDKVTRKIVGPIKAKGKGFKFFEKYYCGELDFPFQGGEVKLDEWLIADIGAMAYQGKHEEYTLGFHVFSGSAKEAWTCEFIGNDSDRTIIPVQTRWIVAAGEQYGLKCEVALEMKVSSAALKKFYQVEENRSATKAALGYGKYGKKEKVYVFANAENNLCISVHRENIDRLIATI